MSEKPIRELVEILKRKQLTAKQEAFVQAYTTPGKGLNNASQAYRIAYPNCKGGYDKLGPRLMGKDGIKATIAKIRADLAAENGFTREKQLKDLELAKKIAQGKLDSSGMVSATREQNEMLGFHRELAPNAEREAARRAVLDTEKRKVAEKVAKLRTDEESGERTVRIGA